MAPPRKKQRTAAARPDREYKIRLPEDVAGRIEQKAAREQRPQNRIIINELAAFPDLEKVRDLAESVEDMKVVLAQQGARIMWLDLSDELLSAVDAVVRAQGSGALHAAIDKLRVVRTAMLKSKPKG
jgi:hypothetical protein